MIEQIQRFIILAKAGIFSSIQGDSRLRWNDGFSG